MTKFKSITVDETTYAAVDRMTETLLPGAKLSRAQVVANRVKGSHKETIKHKEDHETGKRHTEDTPGT